MEFSMVSVLNSVATMENSMVVFLIRPWNFPWLPWVHIQAQDVAYLSDHGKFHGRFGKGVALFFFFNF